MLPHRNIEAKKELALDERSTVSVRFFVCDANIALQNTQIYIAALGLVDNLDEAIQTSDVIGQAKAF